MCTNKLIQISLKLLCQKPWPKCIIGPPTNIVLHRARINWWERFKAC